MRLILVLYAIAFITGCHKHDITQTTGPQTFFRFTIDGKTDSITSTGDRLGTEGAIIQRVYFNASYYYNLTAVKNTPAGSFLISLNFFTAKLSASTYLYQYTGVTDFNIILGDGQAQSGKIVSPFLPVSYASYQPGDETIISITRLQNQYADGTYSAPKLSPVSGCSSCPPFIEVVKGTFKNIRVED